MSIRPILSPLLGYLVMIALATGALLTPTSKPARASSAKGSIQLVVSVDWEGGEFFGPNGVDPTGGFEKNGSINAGLVKNFAAFRAKR